MATIYTRAAKGSALTWTEGDANITNLNNAKIENVVEDLTPQLGGDLDVNGKVITSASNGNIAITPNGTGSVVLDGNAFPQDQGVADQVLITDGAGQLSWSEVKTVHSLVYNADSVTINKGQPVYLFGANGANPSVKLASNTADTTSATTYGIANEDIAAGATGNVVTQGLIKGVNTSTYTEGAIVYLGATAGTLTTTKPYAPNHLVYLGVVTSVNSTSGRILVKVQNGYELDEIHNVQITTTPSDGQVLTYESSTSLWKAKTPVTTSPAGSNTQIQFNNSGSFGANSNLTWDGTYLSATYLKSSNSSGDEGGEILLAKPATNSTISGTGVTIDVYQNRLRIFEQGGSARGAYIDLTAAATGVGTNLLSGGGGISDVVADTTPQLGGDLDVNGKAIVSVSNGNIRLEPNGSGNIALTPASGKIILGASDWPSSTGTNGQVLTTNGTGTLSWTTVSGGISDVVADTTPQLGGNLDVNGNAIVSASNGNIRLEPNGSGNIQLTPSTGQIILGSTNYPTGTPTSGQVLAASNGTGQLAWTTISSGVTVSDDTTTNATRYIVFEDVTSGSSSTVGVSSSKLTFNPSTGVLTATGFSGPLTGNADTATTATNANNINISTTDGNTSDTTMSVVLVGAQTTGNQAPHIDAGLTYNASTNALTATTFVGALSGNATNVSGTVALANGGTGQTSAPAALAALMGFTSTATAGGTTILSIASTHYQIFTGTSAQTVQLPNTGTLAQGWTFHICNNSTGNLTVNSSLGAGNTVITIIPGTTAMVTCINTASNAASSWESGLTDFSTYTGTGSVVLGTSPSISGLTITGTLNAGGGVGTSGQVLQSTGTGVQWASAGSGASYAILESSGSSITINANSSGTLNPTWTEILDANNIVTTNGSTQFTLGSGTFLIEFSSTGMLASGTTGTTGWVSSGGIYFDLYNATNAILLDRYYQEGARLYSGSNSTMEVPMGPVYMQVEVTPSSSTTYEIRFNNSGYAKQFNAFASPGKAFRLVITKIA